jgi:hypothetical protein
MIARESNANAYAYPHIAAAAVLLAHERCLFAQIPERALKSGLIG